MLFSRILGPPFRGVNNACDYRTNRPEHAQAEEQREHRQNHRGDREDFAIRSWLLSVRLAGLAVDQAAVTAIARLVEALV